jgi:lipoyl(octanoyl) transferase
VELKFDNELVDYEYALNFMEERVNHIIEGKKSELIWFLQHPPLYTAGSSANSQDLISNNGFKVYQTGRGGQYTYHGPGQRICYVMLNLKNRNPDIREFVRNLELVIIKSLQKFDVKGETRQNRVGVWVKTNQKEEKIAAIGIRLKKWVSYHGIAININPDLSHYKGIIPCGIKDYGVTSLEKLGIKTTMAEFDKELKKAFTEIFN